MKNFKKGFTLIELLVVVAIIGVLVSVIMVSLISSRTKSQIAAFETEMKSLTAAINVKCSGGDITLTNADITNGKTFNKSAGTTIISGCSAGTWSLTVVSTNGAGKTAACDQNLCEFGDSL